MRLLIFAMLAALWTNSGAAAERWVVSAPGRAGGIVTHAGGAAAAIGGSIAEVADDGHVTSSRQYSISELTMARAGDGYALTGIVAAAGKPSAYVAARARADGTIEWARRIAGDDVLISYLVAGADDGGFCTATNQRIRVRVACFNRQGTTRWQRSIHLTGNGRVRALMMLRDQSVIVVGDSVGENVMRISAAGDVLWQRVFSGGRIYPVINNAVEMPDGDLFFCGAYADDVLYGKLSAKSGNIIWQRAIGGHGHDYAAAVAMAGRDRFAVVAATDSFGPAPRSWLLIVDGTGVVKSQHTFSTVDMLNYRASVAAAADGSIWVNWAGGIPAMVARVDQTGTCGGVATSEVARKAALAPIESPADVTSIPEATEPIAIAVNKSDVVTKDACLSAAPGVVAGSAANPLSPVPPRDDTDEFSDRVIAMFKAKKFRDLDALASQVRRERATFPVGAWKIWWFMDAFNPGDREALQALGDARVSQLFNEWSKATQSATSRAAHANYLWGRAWQVRGEGYGNTVTQGAWRRYDADMAASVAILDDLQKKNACDVSCLEMRIRTKHLGGWSPELREIVKKEPTYWHAIAEAGLFLLPQWGGSVAEIEKFAREAADATRPGFGDAAYMKVITNAWPHAEGEKPKFDWKLLKKGFEDFQRRFPDSSLQLERFVRFAYQAGDRDTARTILIANPRLNIAPQVREWALQTTAAPIAAGHTVERTTLNTGPRIEHPIAFAVVENGKVTGVSAAALLPRTWTDQPGRTIASAISTAPGARSILFDPAPTLNMTPFPISHTEPAGMGSRFRIIACASATSCTPAVFQVRVSAMSSDLFGGYPIDDPPQDDVTGAPVVDDQGGVIGIIVLVNKGNTIPKFEIEPIVHALRRPRSTVPLRSQ